MKFLKRRRDEKLYRQWVQHNGLPPEAVPQREVTREKGVGGEGRDRLRPYKEKVVDLIRRLLKV